MKKVLVKNRVNPILIKMIQCYHNVRYSNSNYDASSAPKNDENLKLSDAVKIMLDNTNQGKRPLMVNTYQTHIKNINYSYNNLYCL